MSENQLPEWRRKALADPELKEWQVESLMKGPQTLAQAWFLRSNENKVWTIFRLTTWGFFDPLFHI